jgi:hypothetical protein
MVIDNLLRNTMKKYPTMEEIINAVQENRAAPVFLLGNKNF